MGIDFDVVDDNTLEYNFNGNTITTTLKTSGGSAKYYTGGFEVLLKDYNDLFVANDLIEKHTTREFSASAITERNEEIFNWLNMLDLNVYIIIGLMILVAIINMTSALLVIILERTQMIGILKALGTRKLEHPKNISIQWRLPHYQRNVVWEYSSNRNDCCSKPISNPYLTSSQLLCEHSTNGISVHCTYFSGRLRICTLLYSFGFAILHDNAN